MLTKRIVPCLDVKGGRTVKGVAFEGLRDAGDPVELAARYAREGADELVFLDITATNEKRATLVPLVRAVARELDVPFTVGGGVSSVADLELLLANGADKASVNSAALRDPSLVDALAARFGSQCVVVAVDARREADGAWRVYGKAGTEATGRDAVAWCAEVARRGAGEILLTAMNHDGGQTGFATGLVADVARAVPVPVIASGGAGTMDHFVEVLGEAGADAALAASVFHFGTIPIPALKAHLHAAGIPTRLT